MLRFEYPGPRRNVSYHNHSNWSDGADTLEEVCHRGKAMGLRELGVSDHWVPAPDFEAPFWSMKPDQLGKYTETLLTLKKQLDDENFTLRIGLEVDFFHENYREVLADLKQYPFDYLIGSVHYSGSFPLDESEKLWMPLEETEKDRLCRIYWDKLLGAAECGEFTFLGHLDLPKKFACVDMRKYLPEACQVLDAAKETGTAIELNTAGWFKPCNEQYPCAEILAEAKNRRIPVIVNADAHAAEHLMRNFEEASEVLQNI